MIATDLGAVILCGGRSRRMGRSKAWLPFGPDEVLLQRVVRQIGRSVGPIVVVAAADQIVPPLPPAVRVVCDSVADRGPMQGLADGLAELPDSVEYAYVSATDTPFLAPGWIAQLRKRIGDHDLAIPCIAGRFHPLSALYRRNAGLHAILVRLREDQLRLISLVETLSTLKLTEVGLCPVDPDLITLRNLNTPSDHKASLAEQDTSSTA